MSDIMNMPRPNVSTTIQAAALLLAIGGPISFTVWQTTATAENVEHLTSGQYELAERTRLLENIAAANSVRHESIKTGMQRIQDTNQNMQKLLLKLVEQKSTSGG